MDLAQVVAIIDHKETHGGASIKEDAEPIPAQTSSDDLSDEDFFQLEASELNKLVAGRSRIPGAQHGDNVHLASEFRNHSDEEAGLLSGSQVPTGRPYSLDVSGVSLGSDLSILGARQSPPVQVMGRSDVPDPNRLPSSIFVGSKSTTPMEWTPMEWSAVSNESLFSIHVGNSSFSSSPLDGHTPPSSSVAWFTPVSLDVGSGMVQRGAATAAAAAANAEAMRDVLRAAAAERAEKDQPPAVSISRHSDASTSSFLSFAFPILAREGRSGSMKVEPEPQPPSQKPSSQQETPAADPAAAECKWLPCFTCCPSCC